MDVEANLYGKRYGGKGKPLILPKSKHVCFPPLGVWLGLSYNHILTKQREAREKAQREALQS